MARMTAWAHFHECREAADIASLAAAFAEAGEEAGAAGCEVRLAGEDAGDREVEARGTPGAVAGAAVAFGERGFYPQVEAPDHAERRALLGLLPDEIPVHLEASGAGLQGTEHEEDMA